ncbi:MAG TPA: hypothetical protein VMT10_01100, partial [Solirubrobacteraceae bacterium]|nr:hypothetical protein [Solirubrobacteraceae bacterium]
GLPFRARTLVVVAGGIGAAGLMIAAWRQREDPARRPPGPRGGQRPAGPRLRGRPPESYAVTLTGLALAAYLVVGLLASRVLPLAAWDSWSIWARKADLVFVHGTLPVDVLASPQYAFAHPDYPMLVPLMETAWFRAVGNTTTQALHAQFWLLLVAFLLAGAFLARRVSPAAMWLPLLALVGVVPGVRDQLLTMYADVPMAMFLAIGALLGGLWLVGGRRSDLALAALFLAAAANSKNEGLSAAVATLAALLVVVLTRPAARKARAIAVAITSGAVLTSVLPWHIWLSSHNIVGDTPLRKGLEPGYLVDRAWRVWPTVRALAEQIGDGATWLYLVPLGLGVALAGLATRRIREPSAYYLLSGVFVFTSLVWAYVITPDDLHWRLQTSANRVVVALVFLAVAALLQLAGSMLRGDAGGAHRADGGS